jgi:hypothetical protein
MKGLLVTLVTAALVVAAVFVLDKRNEEPPPGEVAGQIPLAPKSGSLRNQLLHSTAQQMGVTPVRGVWGVVMERGYAKGIATIIALRDGTASLSLSTGGSVVEGRAYPPAHAAALKLCEQAADSLSETVTTRDFPSPAKGRVRFYVLTADGVRVAEGDLVPKGAAGARDSLEPLLTAGDAVLDGLKEATSKGVLR